jgi:enamine deaminase RidA (YjgF/YER057c/UK114 family)
MSTRLLLLSFAAASLAAGPARAEPPQKTVFIPKGWSGAYDDSHYAPVVKVGDLVIVSGVPAGGEGTYEEKVRRMFLRVKSLLAAAGAEMSDVVELQSFHAESRDNAAFRAEIARFLTVHREFFPVGYPAWTAVGTTVLYSPGAVLELRAVAVVGSGKRLEVRRAEQSVERLPPPPPP